MFMLLTVNDQLPLERFALHQKAMTSTSMTRAHSSSKAKPKQTLAPPIFTASACHTSLLSVQSEGFAHRQSHKLCDFTQPIFGVALKHETSMRRARRLFALTGGVLGEERARRPRVFRKFSTALAEKTWFSQEHSPPEDTRRKHRLMCGFSGEALPEEMQERRKTTKHRL